MSPIRRTRARASFGGGRPAKHYDVKDLERVAAVKKAEKEREKAEAKAAKKAAAGGVKRKREGADAEGASASQAGRPALQPVQVQAPVAPLSGDDIVGAYKVRATAPAPKAPQNIGEGTLNIKSCLDGFCQEGDIYFMASDQYGNFHSAKRLPDSDPKLFKGTPPGSRRAAYQVKAKHKACGVRKDVDLTLCFFEAAPGLRPLRVLGTHKGGHREPGCPSSFSFEGTATK